MKRNAALFLLVLLLIGSGLLYADSGILIVDNYLGVATLSPSFPLDVTGNTRLNGKLGLWGTSPADSAQYGLYMAPSFNNPTSMIAGVFDVIKPTYALTPTSSFNTYAARFHNWVTVNSVDVYQNGITVTGAQMAIFAQALRNYNGAGANDGGTLTSLYGVNIGYGHNASNTSTAPQTTNAYGLYISPSCLTGTIANMYDLYLGTSDTGERVAHKWGIYQANTGNNYFGGNVTIGGASDIRTDGPALVIENGGGKKPTANPDQAGLYAQKRLETTELFAFDNLTATQLTAHAQDAPDSLYDEEDSLPMIVVEIQHYLGRVRYTNKTRLARLTGMTEAEKSALPASKRICMISESFADHEARTGEHLTALVWEEEQAKIKQNKDAQREAALASRATLASAISQVQKSMASASADDQAQLRANLADLQQQMNTLVVPDVYQVKTIPPRLQAALNKQRVSN